MADSPVYDVFLCHNSEEKAEVEKIRDRLQQIEIYAWLDKYDFEPFVRWQDQLEKIISQIKAVAVFIGSSGVGPWADIEMHEFLVEFAKRKLRMGLVILPDCPDELIDTVPRFMKSFHWVDFRESQPDPMEQLIWGITGKKHEIDLKTKPKLNLRSENLLFVPSKHHVELIDALLDALCTSDTEEAIRKFAVISHPSLFIDGKIEPSFWKKNFKPSIENAKKYRKPLEIIEIVSTKKTRIGRGNDREYGSEKIFKIARDNSTTKITGSVYLFFSKNSSNFWISNFIL